MFLQEAANPNGWAVLIAVVGMLGTILTQLITYKMTQKQSAKVEKAAIDGRVAAEAAVVEAQSHTPVLGEIKTAVNGRLDAALEASKTLAAQNAALAARVSFLEGKASNELK